MKKPKRWRDPLILVSSSSLSITILDSSVLYVDMLSYTYMIMQLKFNHDTHSSLNNCQK